MDSGLEFGLSDLKPLSSERPLEKQGGRSPRALGSVGSVATAGPDQAATSVPSCEGSACSQPSLLVGIRPCIHQELPGSIHILLLKYQ